MDVRFEFCREPVGCILDAKHGRGTATSISGDAVGFELAVERLAVEAQNSAGQCLLPFTACITSRTYRFSTIERSSVGLSVDSTNMLLRSLRIFSGRSSESSASSAVGLRSLRQHAQRARRASAFVPLYVVIVASTSIERSRSGTPLQETGKIHTPSCAPRTR